MTSATPLVLAVPKGRILGELRPILAAAGIEPEPAFDDKNARQLQFSTNVDGLSIIRVRAFDVATFVAFGAAHLGVAGNDVLLEFDYPELYAPVDLGIGVCRISVAQAKDKPVVPELTSHVRIATKYPNITSRFYAQRGLQAECIKLNGAMELAPALGLASRIVDLVSTGGTLKANGLAEVEVLHHVTSRLIVNRAAYKTRASEIAPWVDKFRQATRNAA
ncbi:MAG: ATP phosphoribosyltransferase [Pseudomonadota bacterium]